MSPSIFIYIYSSQQVTHSGGIEFENQFPCCVLDARALLKRNTNIFLPDAPPPPPADDYMSWRYYFDAVQNICNNHTRARALAKQIRHMLRFVRFLKIFTQNKFAAHCVCCLKSDLTFFFCLVQT